MPKKTKKTAFAVLTRREGGRGRTAHIFPTWGDAFPFCNKQPGVRFKGFPQRAEALAWIRKNAPGLDVTEPGPAPSFVGGGIGTEVGTRPAARPRKRTREADRDTAEGTAASSRAKVARRSSSNDDGHRSLLFTDGGCEANGTPMAAGGYGFAFRGDFRRAKPPNGFGPLPFDGTTPTNNRAEMFAMIMALETLLRHRENVYPRVAVFVDNKITLNICLDPHKARPGAANQDLLKRLCFVLGHVRTRFPAIAFRHVKGHSGDPGNDAADTYATAGVQLYKKYIP